MHRAAALDQQACTRNKDQRRKRNPRATLGGVRGGAAFEVDPAVGDLFAPVGRCHAPVLCAQRGNADLVGDVLDDCIAQVDRVAPRLPRVGLEGERHRLGAVTDADHTGCLDALEHAGQCQGRGLVDLGSGVAGRQQGGECEHADDAHTRPNLAAAVLIFGGMSAATVFDRIRLCSPRHPDPGLPEPARRVGLPTWPPPKSRCCCRSRWSPSGPCRGTGRCP